MFRTLVEKFGSVGAVIAAAACPMCFPKIALISAIFGLGSIAPSEMIYSAYAVQGMVLVAFVGQLLVIGKHRNWWLLALSALSTGALFYGYYVDFNDVIRETALVGVVAASIWLVVEMRLRAKRKAVSELPNCCPTTVS